MPFDVDKIFHKLAPSLAPEKTNLYVTAEMAAPTGGPTKYT